MLGSRSSVGRTIELDQLLLHLAWAPPTLVEVLAVAGGTERCLAARVAVTEEAAAVVVGVGEEKQQQQEKEEVGEE